MNRIRAIILVILFSIFLLSCDSNEVEKENKETDIKEIKSEINLDLFTLDDFTDKTLNHYMIDAKLDSTKNRISASQLVTYTNNENIDLEEIYFHLYPNAFTKEGHPSLFDSGKSEIDSQYGSLIVNSVKINGKEVTYSIEPIATVLKINYPDTLKIDESYSIELVYDITIPSTSERFGSADGLINLGNWYPVLSVYDEDGWNLDPYYNIGDPFYSESSNYDINFDVPDSIVVATSGYIHEKEDQNARSIYKMRGDRIRDFALVMSDRFEVISETVGATEVYLYYPEELNSNSFIESSLEYGANAIKLYNDIVGLYPYKSYSIVITNFPSGMEFPGLVLISRNYYNASEDSIRTVIVHETAHQWFYGMIGDDQIEEGWIDEGLTTFMTAYYELEYFGDSQFEGTINHYKNRLNEAGGKESVEMIKSARDYTDWSEYGLAAYTKSGMMFNQLYEDYGNKLFLEFIQRLYEEYSFKVIKEDDIVRIAEEVFSEDLDSFFGDWLE